MVFDDDVTSGAPRSRSNRGAPDQVDRILVAACIVIWLAALGASVAAIVALVDLSRADTATPGDTETPWLLYTVIGVSAVVIAGAIPLLIRARRAAGPASRPAGERADEPLQRQKLEPFGAPVIRRSSAPSAASSRLAFPTAAVDQVWLRGTTILAGGIGAATALIAVATYLMASDHDSAGWAAYGVVAVITVALPAVPWFFLRRLRTVLGESALPAY